MFRHNRIIVIAGFTSKKYERAIRRAIAGKNIDIWIAHKREAFTPVKEKFLTRFATVLDLHDALDRAKLSSSSHLIDAVLCYQERDMDAYIETLLLTKRIREKQNDLYRKAIDKKLFKETLREVDSSLVPLLAVVDDNYIREADSYTYPKVVKPSAMTGSAFVQIVRNAQELREAVARYRKMREEAEVTTFDRASVLIAEEYVDGLQYSVNAYVSNKGNITLAPLIRVVPAVEIGINDTYSAIQYVTDEISAADEDSLRQALSIIVETFFIRSTSMHFDAVLTKTGWKFFEVGLRVGGNREKLYDLTHGFSHVENDVRNKLGERIVIPRQNLNAAIIQKASAEYGTLKSVSYHRFAEEAEAPKVMEDKIAKIGEQVQPIATGGGTIIRAFVKGKNLYDVVKTSKDFFDDVQFDIEKPA